MFENYMAFTPGILGMTDEIYIYRADADECKCRRYELDFGTILLVPRDRFMFCVVNESSLNGGSNWKDLDIYTVSNGAPSIGTLISQYGSSTIVDDTISSMIDHAEGHLSQWVKIRIADLEEYEGVA